MDTIEKILSLIPLYPQAVERSAFANLLHIKAALKALCASGVVVEYKTNNTNVVFYTRRTIKPLCKCGDKC